ncbi:GNAT family N-acetyltransferase [Rhodobacter sp. KR11]|jgi:predicted GNAT family N-acyltransferase|uniref:GNAT family N-acetyltransferase n=1 Tax=Rhodobacter sp. KR11 TaxID=2974588 RepID=UPI0022222E93|nr:GNAT family N-acetyltransferase [Rhodobacter sp. KR11]MCW1918289.1 GNAT family N-acetyltransferase [Rhodobacter sp. KR11]
MSLTIAETRDIALCRRLRREVFIEEQGVPEADEVDDLDEVAIHLLAEEGGALGSARLLIQGDTGKIGRVCVLQSARGRGIGAALIRAAVDRFRLMGLARAKLGAQVHALGFYEALGFEPVGEVYQDAGIAHRDMVLPLGREPGGL